MTDVLESPVIAPGGGGSVPPADSESLLVSPASKTPLPPVNTSTSTPDEPSVQNGAGAVADAGDAQASNAKADAEAHPSVPDNESDTELTNGHNNKTDSPPAIIVQKPDDDEPEPEPEEPESPKQDESAENKPEPVDDAPEPEPAKASPKVPSRGGCVDKAAKASTGPTPEPSKSSDPSPTKSDKDKDAEEKEEVVDNAGEPPCIRREVTPLGEKDAVAEEAEPSDDVPAEEPTEEKVESKTETPQKATPSRSRAKKSTPAKAPTPEKEEEEAEPEEEVTPARGGRSRRSVKATPVAEPKKTPARTPKSAKVEKPAEKDEEEVEATEEEPEAPAEEPVARRRSTRASKPVIPPPTAKKTPAKSPVAKKTPKPAPEPEPESEAESEAEETVEEEKPTDSSPKKRSRASSVKSKTPASTATPKRSEESVSSTTEQKTPAGRRGKKAEALTTPKSAPARGKGRKSKIQPEPEPEDVEMKSDDESESEAEAEVKSESEDDKKASASKKATPKKRKAVTTPKTEPAAKRRARAANTSSEDPFNFDNLEDNHPSPFNSSVSIKRTSFNDVRFVGKGTASPSSKYSKFEKSSSERQNIVGKLLENADKPKATPKSSRTPSKTATKKTPAKTPKNTQTSTESTDDLEFNEESDTKSKTTSQESKGTPASTKKPKKSIPAVTKTPKVEQKAPELSAEEQAEVDDPKHSYLQPGARVFAIWGKEYYSAVVSDRDGLGRYVVFYTEDNSVRTVPSMGIVPLHLVHVGGEVTMLGETDEDGERVIYDGKVLAIPALSDKDEWFAGVYTVEVINEDLETPETRSVPWFDLYFTEKQYKAVIKNKKNATELTDENVLENNRRSLRNRATPSTPATAPTPKSQSRGRARPSATPKRAAPAPAAAQAEEPEPMETDELPDPEPTPKTPEPSGSEAAHPAKNSPQKTSPSKAAAKPSDAVTPPISTDSSNQKFFENMKFILTSANRNNAVSIFPKREIRRKIEINGGRIIDTLDNLTDATGVYLVADTYYRTHKYLTALSLSIPTVHFAWINDCIEKNQLLPHTDYMLNAGESIVDQTIQKWKPLKGNVLNGKRIGVYSINANLQGGINLVCFPKIWSPIIENLGGEVFSGFPSDDVEKTVRLVKSNVFDYLLVDDNTPPAVSEAGIKRGVPVITSEWIIQTIIMGEPAGERFTVDVDASS